jgi:mycothiol synthase
MPDILSANVVIRAPREDELETICQMLNTCDQVDCGMPDSPLDQLRGEWREEHFHPETDAWVAVAPGERIIAYATVNPSYLFVRLRSNIRVHPDYRGQGIGSYLLSLAEKRAREFVALAPPEARVVLQTWHHGRNEAAKQLIEAAGFICNRHTWVMRIDLSEEPVAPQWPAGIVLRPFVPERDARAVFQATDEAFSDHWGHLPGNFEHWYQHHIANQDDFDPALWFIAMDGDQVAGVALCSYYLDNGLVDTLGVRRPWRRSGLGMALLRHAFGEFYRRGTHTIDLGVDSQNLTGATRLYERAGMHILMSYDQYEKELRAGVDRSVRALEV